MTLIKRRGVFLRKSIKFMSSERILTEKKIKHISFEAKISKH
jgi:hypothetical protein